MKKILKVIALSIGAAILLFVCFFFIIKKLDAKEMEHPYPTTHETGKPILLPSAFLNGERFCIKIASVNGDTMLGFGDTGGGISMAFPATIDKFNLQSKTKSALLKGL